jgi:hypothetical protein
MAFVAARLHGIPFNGVPEWAETHLGLRFSKTRMQNALASVRLSSAHKKRPGPPGAASCVPEDPFIEDSLVIDEQKLGVLRVLFRLPNDGLPQAQLLEDLEGLPGVRQILELDSTRDVLVVALAGSMSDADDLRARIQDFVPGRGVVRDIISFESHAAMPATWKRLAKDAAKGT